MDQTKLERANELADQIATAKAVIAAQVDYRNNMETCGISMIIDQGNHIDITKFQSLLFRTFQTRLVELQTAFDAL